MSEKGWTKTHTAVPFFNYNKHESERTLVISGSPLMFKWTSISCVYWRYLIILCVCWAFYHFPCWSIKCGHTWLNPGGLLTLSHSSWHHPCSSAHFIDAAHSTGDLLLLIHISMKQYEYNGFIAPLALGQTGEGPSVDTDRWLVGRGDDIKSVFTVV